MKRKITILLVLSLFFLCACEAQPEAAVSNPTFDYALVIRDGVSESNHSIGSFRAFATGEYPCSLSITRHENGTIQEAVVEYDGSSYTITDENGSRSYPYLIYSAMISPTDPSTFSEYFFLTEDPEMTAERYWASVTSDIAPTEVMYVEHTTFDLAQSYGNVPQQFETLISLHPFSTQLHYAEKSVFSICGSVAVSSSKQAYLMKRYGYDGVELSESTVKGYPNRIGELSDGSFVLFTYSYEDGAYCLCRYQEDGSLDWEHSFEGGRTHVTHIIEHDKYIYCFGAVTPKDSDSDLNIWQFSLDGELLQQKTIGGSDFDSIDHVEKTDKGFSIWGSTQSGDGDLPFSEDGYRVPFLALIDNEMELITAQESEDAHSYLDKIGVYQGRDIYNDDPLLNQSSLDKLPDKDGLIPTAIFSWNDGYIIVRTYKMGAWPFSNTLMSYQPSYTQIIYTGYDANGVPQWQTAGDIFVE